MQGTTALPTSISWRTNDMEMRRATELEFNLQPASHSLMDAGMSVPVGIAHAGRAVVPCMHARPPPGQTCLPR